MVSFFKVHLARGSASIMGSLYKVLLSRDSDPYMWSLFSLLLARGSASNMGPFSKFYSRTLVIRTCVYFFSKCTSRVVVVRSWDRWLAGEAGNPASKIHWARTRPSAKSFPAETEGKAGKRQWDPRWSKSCYDTKLPVRGN